MASQALIDTVRRLVDEQLFPLSDNAPWPKRNGKAPSLCTRHRWHRRGARAADGRTVFLEAMLLPSGLHTSREAIIRFFAAINSTADAPAQAQAAASAAPSSRAHAERQRRADAALDAALA